MSKLHDFTQYFTTTLSKSGGLTAVETTGIVLQSISGVDDYTRPGVVCLTYANPLVQTTAEWITYTSIDNITKELQGVVRGAEGSSAKTHLNGCIIAFVLSKTQIKAMRDRLEGTSGSVVEDGTGLEILKKVGVASAVNEVTLTNAVTGSGPIVSATGDDSNIDLKLMNKGTGNVRLGTALLKFPNADGSANQALVTNGSGTLSFASAGSTDGWTDGSAYTWVYASASTFTIAGVDLTTTFTKGTRLKFTQTTVKYAVVVSSSFSTNTTVTILVNTDYTIANAAISANYYSYQLSPQGYPGFFAYTPTLTNLTLGNGSLSFKVSLNGNVAHINGYFAYNSTSSVSGLIGFSIPVATSNANSSSGTMGTILDSGAAFMPCRVYFETSTKLVVYALNAAGTYLAETATSSTVPMTWATNDAITFDISYFA